MDHPTDTAVGGQPGSRAPVDIGIEQIVLGCCMINGDMADQLSTMLSEEMFSRPNHRAIWRAIQSVRDRGLPPDLLIVTQALIESTDIDRAGGSAYLATCYESAPAFVDGPHYARMVRNAAEQRHTRMLATRMQQVSDVDDPELRRAQLIELREAIDVSVADTESSLQKVGIDRGLPFVTLRELREQVVAAGPRKWLLRGVWPQGDYGVHAGEMKAQKSWNTADLIASVAVGTPWLGEVEVDDPGGVVSFVGEGGASNFIRRLDAITGNVPLDELPIVVCTRAPHLNDKAHIGLMADALDHARPRLVTLDPLYLSLGGTKGSDLYAMGEVLEKVQIICQQAGAALWLVTHHNRAVGRGASRITGAGPAEWGRVLVNASVEDRHTNPETQETTVITELDIMGGEVPDRTLRVVRRIRAEDPSSLDSPFHYEVDCKEVTEEDKRGSGGLSPSANMILLILKAARGAMTVKSIGDECAGRGRPLKRETISRACKSLVESKLADEIDSGKGKPKEWIAVNGD